MRKALALTKKILVVTAVIALLSLSLTNLLASGEGMVTNLPGTWSAVWGSTGDTWTNTANGTQGNEDSWDFSKYLHSEKIGNYATIEADVTLDTAGVRAGIFFCGNDDGGYNFSVGIEAYDTMNNYANGAIRFSKNNGEIEPAYESPVAITMGNTYKLKIVQEYTKAKVYINDQPLMDGENIREFDVSEFWAYKKVGLLVRAGKATFNNFNVTEIPVGVKSNLTGAWTEYGDGIGYWNHMPEGSEAANVGWGRARYMNAQEVSTKGEISADLKLVDGGSTRAAIVIKGNADGSQSFSIGIEEGSNLRFERMDEQVNYTVPSPVAFTVGTTYNIKVVYDEENAKVYINGQPVKNGDSEVLFDVSDYGLNTYVGVLARAGRAMFESYDYTATSQEPPVDYFKTNLTGDWSIISGSFVKTVDGIVGTEPTWQFGRYLNSAEYEDGFVYEADILIPESNTAEDTRGQLLFRANDDASQYYSLGIEPFDSGTVRLQASGVDGFAADILNTDIIILKGTQYHLKVIVGKNKIFAYVDDALAIYYTDAKLENNKKCGLLAAAGSAIFNNVNIREATDADFEISYKINSNLAGDWIAHSGKWTQLDKSGVSFTSISWEPSIMANTATVRKDLIYEADLKITEGADGRAMLVFRADKDFTQYYAVGIEATGNVRLMAVGVAGWPADDMTFSHPFELNKTYHVKLKMTGNDVVIFVDGKIVGSGSKLQLAENRYCGLMAMGGGTMVFDNVTCNGSYNPETSDFIGLSIGILVVSILALAVLMIKNARKNLN